MKKQKSKTSDGAAKDPSLHAKANKIIKMPKRCKSKYDNSLWTPEDIADDFLESRKAAKIRETKPSLSVSILPTLAITMSTTGLPI